MSSLEERIRIEREGYAIAKSILKAFEIESYGEHESEEKKLTMTNLRNMLNAAREAKKLKNYDYFALRVAYIARNARYGDDLYEFVWSLLRESNRRGKSGEEKIEIAISALTASLYLYTALRNNLRDIIYGKR